MAKHGRGKRRGRSGMALVIILIAMFVFSLIMFAIANQQQHETRYTAISLEQQRAFVLADAGLARALARHVARSYHERWYGAAPHIKDDALPALEHAGRFDESNQGLDEAGTAGLAADRKLEPNGSYAVLVEDRHVGEIGGDPSNPNSKLAFTDVYSRGTIDGPHGEVSALLFARLVISPEPSFFGASAGVTPTTVSDESTPELVKRIIRYKVYFQAKFADKVYQNPNADTGEVQKEVHGEVAQFHQNFLKNRNTFRDLRDPAKVNANFHADTATRAQWTKEQIIGLFAGIAPAADVPSGTNAPTDAVPADGAPSGIFANLWTDHMLRRYRVSDLVPANQGFKYVVGAHPSDSENRVAGNILRAFFGRELDPIRAEFREDASPGVTTGDQLLDLQGAQADLNHARHIFNTEVSSFRREEATAVILTGQWNPLPVPPPPPPPPGQPPAPPAPVTGPIAQSYANSIFLDRFMNTDVPATIDDEMRAECERVNGLGASPPVDQNLYIKANPPGFEFYPLYLRYLTPSGAPVPPPPGPGVGPHTQLSVPELVRLYSKYIESAAVFTTGNPHEITPVPDVPSSPPPNRPPPGSGGGTSGGGGTGGGRPGGSGIGGHGSSM